MVAKTVSFLFKKKDSKKTLKIGDENPRTMRSLIGIKDIANTQLKLRVEVKNPCSKIKQTFFPTDL